MNWDDESIILKNNTVATVFQVYVYILIENLKYWLTQQ